jgi:hypothetical protein
LTTDQIREELLILYFPSGEIHKVKLASSEYGMEGKKDWLFASEGRIGKHLTCYVYVVEYYMRESWKEPVPFRILSRKVTLYRLLTFLYAGPIYTMSKCINNIKWIRTISFNRNCGSGEGHLPP